MLWCKHKESARLSLRGMLAELRKALGPAAQDILVGGNDEVQLAPGRWTLIGGPADGAFLEGLSVNSSAFDDWLTECREGRANRLVSSRLNFEIATEPRATLAALPFAAVPGDTESAMMGDMLAEELTRVMSRTRLLNVISFLSSRSFAAGNVTAEEIREGLGADYAIGGRVRVCGEGYVISCELTDLSTGLIVWSRDFAEGMKEFVKGESQILREIATHIGRALLQSALEAAASRPLHEVSSHHLLISAVALMHRLSLSSFSRARPAMEELISRFPGCAPLHAWLGKWYVLSCAQGWSIDQEKDRRYAEDCTKRALDIDPECGFTLAVDGFVQNNLARRFDLAAARFNEALEHDPNNALAWLLKGNMHAFVDEGDAAVSCAHKALQLSPADPHKYFFHSLSATAFLAANDFDAALQQCEASLRANPRHSSTLRANTIALQASGRTEEAKTSAKMLMSVQPTLTVSGYLKDHPAAAYDTGRSWAKALEGAGVPLH